MQQKVRSIVPKLTPDLYKGQCGRIGVFGGCNLVNETFGYSYIKQFANRILDK